MQATQWLLLSGALVGPLGCQRLDRDEHSPAASVAAASAAVQSPVLTLGQTAQLPSYTAKLVSQRDCGAAGAAQARRTTRAWAVELEITNTGTQRLAVNPFYATLQDDQKFTYTTSLSGCPPLLSAKLLEPRETVRGFVPYELPLATAQVTLHYHPSMSNSVSHAARFQLEL